MKTRILLGVMVLCVVAAVHSLVVGQEADEVLCEDAVNLQKVSLRVVDVVFVEELKGANDKTFKETELEDYRGMVMTLEVRKPANEALSMYAQDFALHYDYGEDDTDVAPCQGISGFSGIKAVDRPMYLNQVGRYKTTTGASTIKEPVVYVDLFFQYMEPTTSDLHLLVGQPIGPGFKTAGWTP